MKKGVLIIISGFSGAGKGTLVKRLMETHDDYALSISMTTRKPRVGEEHGKHYFFVSDDEFEETIRQDGLLEYARYCDHYYGTPKSYVEQCLNEGKNVILEIEIQGALKVREKNNDALLIFVTTANAQILRERLTGRGTETEEVINQRLLRAAQEAEGVENYDYVVVNDDLDRCMQEIDDIVHNKSEKNKDNLLIIKNISQELNTL